MLLFSTTHPSTFGAILAAGLRNASLPPDLPGPGREEAVLVVDAARLPEPPRPFGHAYLAAVVPPEAILNLDPYRPPAPVTAAGGYVLRPGAPEPDVLLIFRRGVWDLPKGKLDEGETVAECALREVREEVGLRELRLLGEAGTTVHGYEEKGKYRIKTTWWYFMHTPQEHFTPQAAEGIERVAWKPWSAAERLIGFDSLREHMRDVRAAAAALSRQLQK